MLLIETLTNPRSRILRSRSDSNRRSIYWRRRRDSNPRPRDVSPTYTPSKVGSSTAELLRQILCRSEPAVVPAPLGPSPFHDVRVIHQHRKEKGGMQAPLAERERFELSCGMVSAYLFSKQTSYNHLSTFPYVTPSQPDVCQGTLKGEPLGLG